MQFFVENCSRMISRPQRQFLSQEWVSGQGEDGPCYSSPLLVEHEGIRQVIEWNHRALVGVESKTGKLLWEFPFPHTGTNQNMPTPSFDKGRVLLGGENRGLHGIEPKL